MNTHRYQLLRELDGEGLGRVLLARFVGERRLQKFAGMQGCQPMIMGLTSAGVLLGLGLVLSSAPTLDQPKRLEPSAPRVEAPAAHHGLGGGEHDGDDGPPGGGSPPPISEPSTASREPEPDTPPLKMASKSSSGGGTLTASERAPSLATMPEAGPSLGTIIVDPRSPYDPRRAGPVVSRGQYGRWAATQPMAWREAVMAVGMAEETYMSDFDGTTPAPGTADSPMTGVPASLAAAYCAGLGGLPYTDAEPQTWDEVERLNYELRQYPGSGRGTVRRRFAWRRFDGELLPVLPAEARASSGFACADVQGAPPIDDAAALANDDS